MKILYLYAEVMGYTMATLNALVAHGAEIHVVHWDHKKRTPYRIPEMQNIRTYQRSAMRVENLHRLANEVDPTITVVSGWMDQGYLEVAKRLRAKGKIVVLAFDNQWHGTLRQYTAVVLAALGHFARVYSHAWVAGVHQYEFIRRLGFDRRRIVFDLYSADRALFLNDTQVTGETAGCDYPHRFLFVGRFSPVKGLDVLAEAWQSLGEDRNDWELHLIGNGPLRFALERIPGAVVKEFMQPDRLRKEIAYAGCFVLPSRSEPWGVVVHEVATSGMPMVVSDIVGAASVFLIPGLNGYSFKAGDAEVLAKRMRQIINSSDRELMAMSRSSAELSSRITPESSAANLLSVLK